MSGLAGRSGLEGMRIAAGRSGSGSMAGPREKREAGIGKKAFGGKRAHGQRRAWKMFAGAVCLCAFLAFGKTESRAEEYAYTITFYPGNHGSFQGTEQVSVDNSGSGSSYDISGDGTSVRVTGLAAGDIVSFDAAMEGAVKQEEGSRYYVKGIRVSGRDNSTVDTAAFSVEGDRDYVVAYGIKGDQTSYVVNYQDGNGNTLAPSRTYYGNVGDKPVVAFLYIEGYQPQAYNLTKTLSKNTAENVFTFVYNARPAAVQGGGEGGTAGEETTGGATGAGGGNPGTTVPGTAAGNDAGTGTGTGTGGDMTLPQGPEENGGNPEEDVQNPEDNTPDEGGQESGEETVQGEEVPDTPENLVDLDNGEVPLAGPGQEETPSGPPVWIPVVLAVAGLGAVAAILWFVWMQRKKKKVSDNEN